MKKLKLLLAAATLWFGGGISASAQEDVTSTYLTNANFSEGTPIDNGICTYGKDMASNNTNYYGPQEISGWTNASVGATDEGYANSKLAGGLFAYGGTPFLGGTGFIAPATDPDENAGNALGLLAVWGGTIQYTQDVTLPAGSYTLRFKTYNATNDAFGSGKFITTNLFGFVANGGATYYAPSKTFAIGQWSTIAVTFNLTEETSGKISVGYVGPGGGAAMPHLFVDNVKILKNTYYEDVTSKVGVDANTNWVNASDGMQGSGVTTDDGRSTKMAARYGTTAESEEVIYQNIAGLKKGTYEAVVFAYSQNEWNNNGATLTHDAGDATYVLADGAVTIKEWINARRGPGYPADGPGIYNLSGIQVGDDGNLKLALGIGKAGQTEWHAIQIKSLIYTKNLDLTALIASYNSKLTEAKTIYNGTDKIGLAVKNSLKDAIDEYDEGEVDQTDSEPLEAAIDALREAIADANASINSYASLLTAITNANNHTIYTPVFEASATIYSNAVSTAQGVYDATEVDDCAAAITALENGIHSAYENDYTVFKDDYEYDYSTLLKQDMTQWASTDYVTMTADQHWNGKKSQRYYEQSSSDWGSNSWEHNASETATLPAGKYVMSITARASADVTSTMKVQVGNSEAITVTLPNKGAEGRGITTEGVGSYADGTYSNNNNGGGWEYRFIAFEVTEESPVTISFKSSTNKINNWVSLASPLLKGDVHPNQIQLNQAKSLAETLAGYEQQITTTTYATFAEHISAANSATVESTDLDEIITNLQADIETAKAEVAALAALQTALEGANAVDQNAKMNGEVLTALQNAIASAVNVAPADLTTVTATLTTATSNATASIANYTEAKDILDAANSYDNDGQASYATNETIAAIQSAYNDGTLVAVTDEQKTAAKTALATACKAQTQPANNCDMTVCIVNPNFDGNANGWTTEKTGDGWTAAPYNNNGQFIEYWTASVINETNPTRFFDYYQTITGLPEGAYTISADMLNSTNGEENEEGHEAVNWNGGGNAGLYGKTASDEVQKLIYNNSQDYATYTTDEILVVDGKLRLGVKNINPLTGRWFAADNFKLTYVRPLTAEEILAEAKTALETAIEDAVDYAQNADAPQGIKDQLESDINAISEASANYTTAEQYVNATTQVTGLKNDATELIATLTADWSRYKKVKAAAEAMVAADDVYEGNSTIDIATIDATANQAATTEAINTAISNLRTATTQFMEDVNILEDKFFDITNVFLENADFSIGTRGQMPIGWDSNYESGVQAQNIGFQNNATYNNTLIDEETSEETTITISQFIEAWLPSSTNNKQTLGDGYLRQTVTNLPEGKYTLEADAISVQQTDENEEITGSYLYIDADGVDYKEALNTLNGKPLHFSTEFLSPGEVDVTFGLKTENSTGNWLCADNFVVKFYGIDLTAYVTQLAQAVEAANALEGTIPSYEWDILKGVIDENNQQYTTSKDYSTAIAAIQTATTTAQAFVQPFAAYNDAVAAAAVKIEELAAAGYDDIAATLQGVVEDNTATEQFTAADYNDATEAISAAIDQADIYAEAKAILDAANIYDEDGQASYAANETIAAIQSAYNDGTLVAVTDEQKAAAKTALDEACKAQTQPANGCDMTPWIVNPNFNGNANGWTTEKTGDGWTAEPYNNGQFIEYWTSSVINETNPTRFFDYYQTITGLPEGAYTITADMLNSTNGEENEEGHGAVDWNDGGNAGLYGKTTSDEVQELIYNNSQDYATYTTDEILVVDGKLRLGVKNINPLTGRWFAADNFKLTYVRQLTDEEVEAIAKENAKAAYEVALAAAKAIEEGTIPASAYSDLQQAISNKTLQDGTSADYDDATEALNVATATATSLVAPYAAWKELKAQADALVAVSNNNETANGELAQAITTQNTAAEDATTSEALITATSTLKSEMTTYATTVQPTNDECFDISFMIVNPHFTEGEGGKGKVAAGWTLESGTVTEHRLATHNFEAYHMTFNLSQTIKDLPKGTYKVTLQGFARHDGNDKDKTNLYCGIVDQRIKDIKDEYSTTSYYNSEKPALGDNNRDSSYELEGETVYQPNGMTGAYYWFQEENPMTNQPFYTNEVQTLIPQDGDLKIGFKCETTTDWVIWDNFHLYYYGSAIDVALNEANGTAYTEAIDIANVTFTKTIYQGWNTIVVPFEATAADFGADALYEYTDDTDDCLNFQTATTIEPNKPYLLKAGQNANDNEAQQFVFKNVKVEAATDLVSEGTNYDFQGTYSLVHVQDGDYILGSDAFYRSKGGNKVKAYRAYIQKKAESNNARLNIVIDGVATGIDTVDGKNLQNTGVYNLSGQKVDKILKKGLYIQNGKKVVLK